MRSGTSLLRAARSWALSGFHGVGNFRFNKYRALGSRPSAGWFETLPEHGGEHRPRLRIGRVQRASQSDGWSTPKRAASSRGREFHSTGASVLAHSFQILCRRASRRAGNRYFASPTLYYMLLIWWRTTTDERISTASRHNAPPHCRPYEVSLDVRQRENTGLSRA
jgi:hypothetical protein